MASSDVEICSAAVVLLGLAPISSLSATARGRTCGSIYPILKDRLLSEYPWRFVMEKAQLSRLSTAPINEWKYAYQLPSAAKKGGPFVVWDDDTTGLIPLKRFEIFSDTLYTDVEEVYIDYRDLANVTESDFPAYFVQLLVYAMAAEAAEPLTESNTKAEHWHRVAYGNPQEQGKGGYYRTARNVDSSQQPPQRVEDFSLITARFGGGRTYGSR